MPESLTACSVQPRIVNFEPTGYLVTYIAVKVDNRGVASSPAPLVSLTCGGVTETAYTTTTAVPSTYWQVFNNYPVPGYSPTASCVPPTYAPA